MSGISGTQGAPQVSPSISTPKVSPSISNGDNLLTHTAETVDNVVWQERSIAKQTSETIENVVLAEERGIATTENMMLAEERALVLGAGVEKFAASTATGLATIPSDSINKRSRMPTSLVVVQATPLPPAHSIETPFAERRYPTYSEASLLSKLPSVGFVAQAKTVVPTRTVSTLILLGTQRAAQNQLGDSGAGVAASWFIAGAAENGINIPVFAVRHQLQTGQAKQPLEALTQVIGKKGVMGLYKCYPLNTVSGFLVNMALNEISPRVTSVIENQFPDMPTGSRVLLPMVIGAATSAAMIPVTQPIFNINFHQLDVHDQRTTLQITKDLIKAGPKALFRGAVYGVKRIALVGAVFNGTISAVKKGEEMVTQKHVEKVTGFVEAVKETGTKVIKSISETPVEDMLTGGNGSAESWKVVKEDGRKLKEKGKEVLKSISETPVEDLLTGGGGSAESWKGLTGLVSGAIGAVTSAASWLIGDINRIGRDPVMDGSYEEPTLSSSDERQSIDGAATGKITEVVEDATPAPVRQEDPTTPTPTTESTQPEEDYGAYFNRVLAYAD